MDQINNGTAAVASIEDVAEYTARVDAQVRAVLQTVMAQRRSASAAVDYVTALASGGEGQLLVAGGVGWS